MTDVADRLRTLGTGIVSDVLDEAGFQNQTLDPALGFIGPDAALCGRAVCVGGARKVATRTAGARSAVLPLYELPALAAPGTVLVLATSGFRGGAVVGELLARDMLAAGVAGVVTDGLVRDRADLAALGLPILAAGAIPTNGARRFEITRWGAAVQLPGPEGAIVTIEPNDVILADDDGALAVPAGWVEAVLALAEELARKEARLKAERLDAPPEARAQARADRLSHLVWLRGVEEKAR